jgi:hypothetical protein
VYTFDHEEIVTCCHDSLFFYDQGGVSFAFVVFYGVFLELLALNNS